MLNLGQEFPDFTADTTYGKIRFHEWLENKWAILFSHPADYTPVCTSELGRVAQLIPEFRKRDVKVLALSCDSVADHKRWVKDICAYSDFEFDVFPYPIIGDESREIAEKLQMLDPEGKDKKGLPVTCRGLFIIGPDKKLKLSIHYPISTGRNFSEVLRVLDALQLSEKHQVVTPADWNPGDTCMVVPSVKEEELPKLFPQGVENFPVPSGKSYIRLTKVPITTLK
ncbi:peroxiredoxin-6-like [Centruroides sculpturatus]|uniref:peroxiredoxin-6-like n=1 Tax=Centruroides sculpturatus TaxID=218467 RepID=UPI000C6CDA92|nr:peroxiredoxin-6-like [Centruroides sculpturatus]